MTEVNIDEEGIRSAEQPLDIRMPNTDEGNVIVYVWGKDARVGATVGSVKAEEEGRAVRLGSVDRQFDADDLIRMLIEQKRLLRKIASFYLGAKKRGKTYIGQWSDEVYDYIWGIDLRCRTRILPSEMIEYATAEGLFPPGSEHGVDAVADELIKSSPELVVDRDGLVKELQKKIYSLIDVIADDIQHLEDRKRELRKLIRKNVQK